MNAPNGLDPFRKTLDPVNFGICLLQWYENDSIGTTYGEDLKIDMENFKLEGFMAYANAKILDGYDSEGIDFVDDMNRIAKWYGIATTKANNREFIEIEQYRVFFWEQTEGLILSLTAVAAVVTFITANVRISLLVVFCVMLVDLLLIGLIYFWDMTLNMFTGINLILALGLAVDYSTHIAHKFLLTKPPDNLETASEQRKYKASNAISQMGSSVFHGAFSSFCAVSVLGWSKSYHF